MEINALCYKCDERVRVCYFCELCHKVSCLSCEKNKKCSSCKGKFYKIDGSIIKMFITLKIEKNKKITDYFKEFN